MQSTYVTGDTFYPGDAAQVCEIQGNEFSCPTADASINATCDRERCPMQGPPMAPIMESQLMTGSTKTDVKSRRQICIIIFEQNWYWLSLKIQPSFGNIHQFYIVLASPSLADMISIILWNKSIQRRIQTSFMSSFDSLTTTLLLIVNCQTRWSLLFIYPNIFGFLYWSSYFPSQSQRNIV